VPPATLTVRPAVDTRPPAESWPGLRLHSAEVSPDQPRLRLVEEDHGELLAGRPVPSRVPVSVDLIPSGVDPRRGPELEDQARTWAPWFAQLLSEALDGRRPLEPLGRWLDEWVLAEVSRRVRVQRRSRTRTPSTPSPPPATVVSLRSQLTHRRVLEVSAHLRRGRRSSALAFQLVRSGDRWRCTALRTD
jgi:hypothetical protein